MSRGKKKKKKAATAVLGGLTKLLHKNAIKYSGNCSQLFCKEVNDAFLSPCLLSQCKMTAELRTIPCRKLFGTSCISEYFIAFCDITAVLFPPAS